jgi:hypothetical protein
MMVCLRSLCRFPGGSNYFITDLVYMHMDLNIEVRRVNPIDDI